jgi:hypothetical protein
MAGVAVRREALFESGDVRSQCELRIVDHAGDRGVDLGPDLLVLGLQIDKRYQGQLPSIFRPIIENRPLAMRPQYSFSDI